MPELIEVEIYRKAAANSVGRRVSAVSVFSKKYLRGKTVVPDLQSALFGARLDHVRRIGKLLLLEIGTAVVGFRFGMTGRLIVDGEVAISGLLYTTAEVQDRHVRFALEFDDGGSIAMLDPRGFGNVELNPDASLLGPDAMGVSEAHLRKVFQASKATLKSMLLDQQKISGIGNLLCDEILWRSGLAPTRIGSSLEPKEIERVTCAVNTTIEELTERGGSHMGDLQSQRHPGGVCPSDGSELQRTTVVGRTSWWCPEHQH